MDTMSVLHMFQTGELDANFVLHITYSPLFICMHLELYE